MRDRAFADTNIVAYLFSIDEPLKRQRSIQALNDYDCQISPQVLNEFCNICIKKWKFSAEEIYAAISKICSFTSLRPTGLDTIKTAVHIHTTYNYSYYDCLIISSALSCGCKILLTEDLTDGQIIQGDLRVKNIFAL
jgi:predicted nucleic acid-binding protein